MISQIWFGFLREYIKFSVFHFTIESPAARAYRCRRCSAPNMIIHLHRVVYTETIVYAPRVANIRTDAECNEWQAGEPSRWQRNGSSSVTSSPFGIRIALPSFRFHFGKQLRPEIASGKRASGAHHTPMRIAFLRARATRRFSSFHSHLALKRTHSRNNRNGKTIGKSQLDAFGVAECILNAHIWWRVQNRLNAFARQPWNSDGDEQMNGLIFRMHCGDNEKELKIEIQQAAGHRSGENAPKKCNQKVVASVVCCLPLWMRRGSLHSISVCTFRLLSAVECVSSSSFTWQKKQQCGTHDANTERSRFKCGICGTTRSKCMQILVQCSCECVCKSTKILSSSLGTCDTERHLMQPNDGGRRQRHTHTHIVALE